MLTAGTWAAAYVICYTKNCICVMADCIISETLCKKPVCLNCIHASYNYEARLYEELHTGLVSPLTSPAAQDLSSAGAACSRTKITAVKWICAAYKNDTTMLPGANGLLEGWVFISAHRHSMKHWLIWSWRVSLMSSPSVSRSWSLMNSSSCLPWTSPCRASSCLVCICGVLWKALKWGGKVWKREEKRKGAVRRNLIHTRMPGWQWFWA